MQRLHENDLTGFLLNGHDNWIHLKMPAIATEDETWNCGDYIHARKKGEALHPERESIEGLEIRRKALGEYNFSGQYQQEPAPLEGGLIKRNWVHYYDSVPTDGDHIVMSWDTASKTEETNDFSVCTTWLIKEDKPRKMYLLHVLREKLEYPDLVKKVHSAYNNISQVYPSTLKTLLIEDSSSGIQLIQELRGKNINIHPSKLKQDKGSRLILASPLFESGQVLLPREADWLEDYINELLRFPRGKFDDQVDSTTQFLLWQFYVNRFYRSDEDEGEFERREFDRWR